MADERGRTSPMFTAEVEAQEINFDILALSPLRSNLLPQIYTVISHIDLG